MPSVEEAAAAEEDVVATNVPLPWVTEYQPALDGKVLAVQVMPSVEVAARAEEFATETNKGLKLL
jgi:hypothetical protein